MRAYVTRIIWILIEKRNKKSLARVYCLNKRYKSKTRLIKKKKKKSYYATTTTIMISWECVVIFLAAATAHGWRRADVLYKLYSMYACKYKSALKSAKWWDEKKKKRKKDVRVPLTLDVDAVWRTLSCRRKELRGRKPYLYVHVYPN